MLWGMKLGWGAAGAQTVHTYCASWAVTALCYMDGRLVSAMNQQADGRACDHHQDMSLGAVTTPSSLAEL